MKRRNLMVISCNTMPVERRENMRCGAGAVMIRSLVPAEQMRHCRLFSEVTVPVGGSIGEHEHTGETEYYVILTGTGEVNDNGIPTVVSSGDCIVTGSGASHSIRNTGEIPLKLIAVIITEK